METFNAFVKLGLGLMLLQICQKSANPNYLKLQVQTLYNNVCCTVIRMLFGTIVHGMCTVVNTVVLH